MLPAPSFSSVSSSNGGQVESSSPLNAVIKFLITTLGGYAQVLYQSGKLPAINEPGHIMSAVFVTLYLYALGLMAECKLQSQLTCVAIIRRMTPLIGILVVVLLLIILFPLLGFAALIVWALLVVVASLGLFQEIIPRPEESGSPGTQENGLPV